jgi:endo-alpha-N-acetylgalactosaminidase
MKRWNSLVGAGTIACLIGCVGPGSGGGRVSSVSLESAELTVRADGSFPRVLSYTWNASGATLPGDAGTNRAVRINGTNYLPLVSLIGAADHTADYRLQVAELAAELDVQLSVVSNVFTFAVTDIRENGSDRVRTLALPGTSFLSVPAGGTITASRVPNTDVTLDVATAKPDGKPVGYTHVVACTKELAASLWNNVLLDTERIGVQVKEEAGGKVALISCPLWTWREVDSETVELPLARVVVTPDANGDGVVDWQDGAIAYRAIEPPPQGAEWRRQCVISQIAMNFASQAQHPFLSVLDTVKRVYLWTDGLGQDIQFKGYQSEGHDSSHPDYGGNVGTRQGGRDELEFVLARMKDFNARGGVHINATEYYPEAMNYSLDLVNTNKKGWAWLDQSYYTDLRYDITSGKLYRRLDELKADLPSLDWIYLDVYFGVGWNARQLARRVNQNGWTLYTEFPGLLERYITWNHTAQDWTQRIWGDGRKSKLARFIQNEFKDTWNHDSLVRGSNDDGFMGWHSQCEVYPVIRSAFVVNLPAKYLQHFAMSKWTDTRADFAGGVRAVVEDGVCKIYRGDKLWNTAQYPQSNRPPVKCTLFMPWDPVKEDKIYHWSDEGGVSTWALPDSWAAAKSVRLYRLADTGRIFDRIVPVVQGKVTLDSFPQVPYVLYREVPPTPPEIVWGERAPVLDPGFDSHTFNWWWPTAAENPLGHVKMVNDARGQSLLVVQGANGAGAEMTQLLHGLRPGQWYSASVWIETTGERTAGLEVRGWSGWAPAWREATKAGWKIVSASSEETAAEKCPAANAIDGQPGTMWHTKYSGQAAKYPHELVVDMGAELEVAGFTYLPRQGGANGDVKRYAFMTSSDGTAWHLATKGDFAPVGEGVSCPVVLLQPVKARYFKFIAHSEMADQDFAAAAELGVLLPPERKVAPFEPVVVTVNKSNVKNFQDNHSKYLTYFQRVKVAFQAPADGAPVELALRADEGEPASLARFDDVRVVAIKPPDFKGHTFFEDFENVDQYWGPFVYGFQGNTRVHLAEAHPPYTDDVVDGKYSLKSMEDTAALLYRSTPALLPLRPDTTYQLSFDYLCDSNNQHRVVVRSDAGGPEALSALLPGEGRTRQSYKGTFTTGPQDDYWLGVLKTAKGAGILSIDNVALDVVK